MYSWAWGCLRIQSSKCWNAGNITSKHPQSMRQKDWTTRVSAELWCKATPDMSPCRHFEHVQAMLFSAWANMLGVKYFMYVTFKHRNKITQWQWHTSRPDWVCDPIHRLGLAGQIFERNEATKSELTGWIWVKRRRKTISSGNRGNRKFMEIPEIKTQVLFREDHPWGIFDCHILPEGNYFAVRIVKKF